MRKSNTKVRILLMLAAAMVLSASIAPAQPQRAARKVVAGAAG